jgi:uncharacterized damage-inducible protein DinB
MRVRPVLESIEAEYRRYKQLAEGAMEQLSEEQLSRSLGAAGNSVTSILWHVAGNLESRFTDFLQSDGEKPWRDRDSEFLPRTVSRAELREKWEKGWSALMGSLAGLEDGQLQQMVTIRGVPLSVTEALHRSLTHVSYHVGQIVFLSKELLGGQWRYLTIPPGGTVAYNENPISEKPPGPPR